MPMHRSLTHGLLVVISLHLSRYAKKIWSSDSLIHSML